MAEKELSLLIKRTEKAPESFQAWGQLAGVYVKLAKTTGETSYFEKAVIAAERSLKLMPRPNPAARLALAQVAAAKHQFKDAIRIAREAGGESESPVARGTILVTAQLAMGDHREAALEAERLVDARPSLGTYSLRALVMAAMGRSAEAIEDFRNALRVADFGEEDESAWVRSLFARQLMRMGSYDDAESVLDSALGLKPSYHLAQELKGELALLRGQPERAEKHFESAVRESMQVIYLARLAEAKVERGERTAGLDLLKQAEGMIRSEPKTGGFGHRLELVKILVYRAKFEEGSKVALLTEAENLSREELAIRRTPEAWLAHARAAYGLRRYREAAQSVREALLSDGSEPSLLHQASLIERALDNPRRAAFLERRALETNPKFSPERSVEL